MDRHAALDPLHPLGDGTRVLVQPSDGVLPLLELIGSAERSVWIKQFTFTHPALLDAVIAAHNAGRDVQGHAEPAPLIGRSRQRCRLCRRLRRPGSELQWSNPSFAVTHEKSMVIDDRLAMIATFNFCEKYFTHDARLRLGDRATGGGGADPRMFRGRLGSPAVSSRGQAAHCCGATAIPAAG